MRILAIETSCDETAVALLEGEGEQVRILASKVRSQIDIHAVYGGVVPEVAAREHAELMLPLLQGVVSQGGDGVDAVAVTNGPGLAPALRVGVEAAKGLAWSWGKPLVPVCHLEGHIYASWLGERGEPAERAPEFPAVALVVSGGHTELVLMKGHGDFERLGETLDDAAGEAFDKVATMLGLGYPGGPKLAALAEGGNDMAVPLPRPMVQSGDYRFSFSGLKTAVLYVLREQEALMGDAAFRKDLAASFQRAVTDVLVAKTKLAAQRTGAKSVILAGGVAANVALRQALAEMCAEVGVRLHVPPFAFSLDNAAMIAVAGYFRAIRGITADPLAIVADPNLDIV
jgi:N6-L-threonylcarbamoyladenine synthase